VNSVRVVLSHSEMNLKLNKCMSIFSTVGGISNYGELVKMIVERIPVRVATILQAIKVDNARGCDASSTNRGALRAA
jgi:hypothetical protein